MSSAVRGLKAALNARGKFKYKPPEIEVDHVVIGGGVVGLAIAQRLCQKFPDKSTFLVERHPQAGEETSSRNSEVIHSGLYYPANSLKTQLCLRGRQLLYERCEAHNIPHQRTGKLVVATESQRPYIENLHRKCQSLTWSPRYSTTDLPVLPTRLIYNDQIHDMEPDLSRDIVSGLWVPTTGIVDSDFFMKDLEKNIMDSEDGELVYSTRAVRIDPSSEGEGGWVVQTITGDGDQDAILARTLINAGGLSAPLILNSILPPEERLTMYYAKGSYASYKGPGVSHVKHLIYPCPDTGKDTHAFHGLGTHLTLDLTGKIKFGPDVEWISPPSDDNEAESDFWAKHLVPDETRRLQIHETVTRYLPGIELEGLQPDYVGIRPKLAPPGEGFQDFVFRMDYSNGRPMVSCLGIESPGLTASLGIAEYVIDELLHCVD